MQKRSFDDIIMLYLDKFELSPLIAMNIGPQIKPLKTYLVNSISNVQFSFFVTKTKYVS